MKITLTLFCLFFMASIFPNDTRAETNYPLSGHPRLFFLSEDEAVLKNRLENTPVLNQVHNAIIAECGNILAKPVQQRVLTGRRLLSVSREAIRRIGYLSYAYRMTGDSRYAARAETEMLAMAAFSDWNPSHFLDVGEMTLAMAIGYDWLYSYLSETSRGTISNAIKSKGIEETTGAKANQWWFTSDNNWNQVCNAGISAGVAAVYDENPAYYQPLIDRAVEAIKIPMGVYKYNGAYPEGYSYWEYGTGFNVVFIDLLQRMWGTDRGLLSMEGFLQTGNFITHMQGTATKQMSGGTLKQVNPQPFNFADAGTSSGLLTGLFWLASQSNGQTILYNEMKKLQFILDNNISSLVSNRLLPFLLIWSKNMTLNGLSAPVETTYMAQGESAMAALRTGWDPGDIYLGVKGGTPSSNHGHMDVGSFVMDALDVRWAMDFGSSDYNTLETNGVDLWNMSQNSERWDVFRYNNMAHNTLTINGNKQLVNGYASIENFTDTPALQSVELNLTPLYKNDVSYCRRKAAILEKRYVEITDSIISGASPVTVRWNLLTQAVPQKISSRVIRLTQSDKALYLVFDGAENVQARAWSTTPSTTYEESNSGTYFTGFEYIVPAGETRTVTIRMLPDGDPLLNGLQTAVFGEALDETFESFPFGSLSHDFVSWRMNPPSNGSMKALLGEVIVNPFKSGINTSDKVLRITRQDDSNYITYLNAGQVTYRGAQAYGYDLRVNSNSVVEFKYYKDAPGKIGIRIYDGRGNMLLVDYADPYEITANYSTAKWRTAQFEVGEKDLSAFDFTASGYLLISPERNGTETYQENELTLYVDDVKMLPLNPTFTEKPEKRAPFTAFYDPVSERIRVMHLPEQTRMIRLYDIIGRKLQEIEVHGDVALADPAGAGLAIYLVSAVTQTGAVYTVKVIPTY